MIGDEARAQVLEPAGRLPDRVIACVGGGSNAIGTFIAVRRRRRGRAGRRRGRRARGSTRGRHGAPLTAGARGVLHGALSAVLQDEDGQILEAHSISAGLDYPGVGPEHACLRDTGRVRYEAVTDDEALAAFRARRRLEGIIPALESAHAIAWVLREPRRERRSTCVTLSGPRRQGPRRGAGARHER